MFHQSFTNITMSINKTLILYENYVCLQFDIKARRVNLQVDYMYRERKAKTKVQSFS